jgi:O-antigen ligase
VIDSHNDWLDVLMQTGAVGLLLLLALQILILKAILRVPGHEKYAFLSVYLAVIVMMFVSNSYVWRIQVGHIYYIMLAYIEIRQTSSTEVKHTVITTDHEKNDALSKYG